MGAERDPRGGPAEGCGGLRLWAPRHAPPGGGRPAQPDHHPHLPRERDRLGGGHGGLHQRSSAPGGDCARGGDRPDDRGLRRGQRADARARRPQAGGPLHGAGHGERRRDAAPREAPGRGRLRPRRDDGDGADALRGGKGREGDAGPGGDPPAGASPEAAGRDRHPARLAGAGGLRREAGGARQGRPRGAGAGLRLGGGRVRGGAGGEDRRRATWW